MCPSCPSEPSEKSLLRIPILYLEKLCPRARSHKVSLAGGDASPAVKSHSPGRQGPVTYLSPPRTPTASGTY